MRSKVFLVCTALAMAATAVSAQTSSSANVSTPSIEGVWRCQMNGLPAITLTITQEGGSLSGAVLFYLHRREPGKAETATPGVPEPLFHPKFDGKTLTFEVSHRRAHPPQTLESRPVRFELKLDGSEKAELVKEGEDDPNAPVFMLVRSQY
jgi:hypothetical protein